MRKIIITAKCHPHLIDYLSSKHLQVDYHPNITYTQLLENIQSYSGVIVTTRIKVDKPFLEKATKLKWIGRLGSGMELVDTTYAATKNIITLSSPEGNKQAVAELCLGMLLCMMRNIYTSFNQIKNYLWQRDENRGDEIQNKTIGIIGYGNTGTAFAKLLTAFEPKQILVYDKYKTNFEQGIIKQTDLATLRTESDIISLHLPLSEETYHFVNDDFLKKMKPQSYLINASRGNVIDTNTLIKYIENKKLKGVMLDVLENEKINQLNPNEKILMDKLINAPNVLLTPHIAGYSHESLLKMATTLIQKLEHQELI